MHTVGILYYVMQIMTKTTWCTYHHWQPPVIRIFSTIIIIPHIFSRHIRTLIFFFTCLCFFLKPRLWKLLKISTLLFFLHFPSLPCDRNESFSFLFLFFFSAVLNFRIKKNFIWKSCSCCYYWWWKKR